MSILYFQCNGLHVVNRILWIVAHLHSCGEIVKKVIHYFTIDVDCFIPSFAILCPEYQE